MLETIFEPSAFSSSVFFEIESFEDIKEDWDVKRTRIKNGEVNVNLSFFHTPRIQFSLAHYTNGIFIEGTPPPHTILISFIQSTEICSFQNNKLDDYELIILRYGQEVDFIANAQHTIFNLAVEESFFLKAFTQYFHQELHETLDSKKFTIKKNHIQKLLLQMNQLLVFFEKHNNLLNNEIYAKMEEEILDTVFSSLQNQGKKLDKSRFDITRAREILHHNIDNFYTISDLVSELQISPRTLQYNFKNKLGLTPKEYLSYLRLNAIREKLLLGDASTTTIASLISKYGFLHPAHFGVEYKRIFGETPSQTLKR